LAPGSFLGLHKHIILKIGHEVKTYFIHSRIQLLPAVLNLDLDSHAHLRYNGSTRTRNNVNSFDFRKIMIEKIRAFETWAWRDSNDNPEDYANMDFASWSALFAEYLENNEND
jgi:hypothetical protein